LLCRADAARQGTIDDLLGELSQARPGDRVFQASSSVLRAGRRPLATNVFLDLPDVPEQALAQSVLNRLFEGCLSSKSLGQGLPGLVD
jgi:hypothetical protein